ncbi:MAG: hypothetical protein JO033_09120 [Acidobacteriaceae bacterium]|nr:hypothetical protein [Acidobacteriaceae bacterium]MBV9501473.1 hypothetical protein [Acidobacteriaceae bacterium]
MTAFEDALRKAMTRREPPAGFTARVLAKTEDRGEKAKNWISRIFSWRLAPVLAVVLLLSAGITYQRHERQVRGERAKQELLVALRIAGSKLRDVRIHVQQVEQ